MIHSHTNLDEGYENNNRKATYPTLNVHFAPRVFKDRIDHRNLPMSVYMHKVESNNVTKLFDQPTPNRSLLREFDLADGLIYQLAEMNNFHTKNPNSSGKRLRIKVLICVCMYNEGQTAINLTLNGIYENLPELEKQGISAEEVGVVLMQDGILKLVENRLERTYAKG
jgi:hypothetical protein